MEKSSYFLEIFGDIDNIAPPIHQRPELAVLPTDDPLHDFSKANRTAEVDRIVDNAFVEDIVGNIPETLRLTPTAPTKSDAPYFEMEELLPTQAALDDLAPNAMLQFEKLVKAARPSRKAILDSKLAPLYRPENRERWNGMLDKLAEENADALDGSSLLRKATAILEAA